jgi:hypothetical protein
MSIPDHTPESAAPAGWYPTGEAGPDGVPVERWWDGAQWSAMVRPVGSGDGGGQGRGRRTRALIAAGVAVVLVGGGLGTYFALHNSDSTAPTAQNTPSTGLGNGNGGTGGTGGNGQGNGGTGNGQGDGGLGGLGGSGGTGGQSASPQPTITGGGSQTVTDPIDGLTIPVPSGWTGSSGSTSGQGSWPSLSTGPYTCPSALAQSNGSSSGSTQCTRGGVTFETTTGTTAQQVTTSDIAAIAKGNYGTLSSHSVAGQGAVTVAGRAGYQVTWKVVPGYSGPGGTVEVIALPVPGESGYFTLIDIGVDDSSQAPTLASVGSQIIGAITDSSAAGA